MAKGTKGTKGTKGSNVPTDDPVEVELISAGTLRLERFGSVTFVTVPIGGNIKFSVPHKDFEEAAERGESQKFLRELPGELILDLEQYINKELTTMNVRAHLNVPAKRPRVGVGVCVVNAKGQVLLGLRHADGSKSELGADGVWTMPGGKVDFREDLVSAVSRELCEETGLDQIKGSRFVRICVNTDVGNGAHYVTIGYLLYIDKEEEERMFNGEPDVFEKWEWFDTDFVPDEDKIFFASQKILAAYHDYCETKE